MGLDTANIQAQIILSLLSGPQKPAGQPKLLFPYPTSKKQKRPLCGPLKRIRNKI
jgi:hypothetical protein